VPDASRIADMLVLAVYLLASLSVVRPTGGKFDRIMAKLTPLAVIVHFLSITARALVLQIGPTFSDSLSAISVSVMAASLWIGRGGRLPTLKVLLVPAASLYLVVALLVPGHQVLALREAGASIWLPLHIGMIFAAMAGFVVEFSVGLIYHFVRTRLKAKRFQGLSRFPSLEVLDHVQYRALVFGFLCLTLGMGAGAAWAADAVVGGWWSDPKVIFTTGVWAWYAISLALRTAVGWYGRWSMAFSLLGFLGLVFSAVAFDFILRGFHGYVA